MSEERTGTSLDRRQLLGAGAAVAVGGLVLNEVLAAPNPAAQVEDRGSDIRIRALRSHRAGSRVYVQLETNQKVTGWGEISALEPAAAAALANSLFELLNDENPTRIEYLWQKMFRAHLPPLRPPRPAGVQGDHDHPAADRSRP